MHRVLVTRPEPGATQTAARLAARGFLPIVAPIQSIVSRELPAPDHIIATLLTSQNAVAACPRLLHDRPVFAVGTATAKLAVKAGFCHVFDSNGDAVALEKFVSDRVSPSEGSLFLPTAPRSGMSLATSLRQRGFHVVRRIAYHTAYMPDLPEAAATELRSARLEAALFFSGETSRHFVHLLQAAKLSDAVRSVQAVSISEQAAVALRTLRWRRISIAIKPNQDAMLALLT